MYFYIIIGMILFEYILSLLVDILNVKSLNPNLPDEFKDVYDQDKYKKSQNYTKSNTKFSFLTSSFSLLVSLYFIFGGLYNSIDLYVRSHGFSEIVTGLLFFALLFVINDLLNIPFSLYKTFVIEEKYGFNKTTLKTFCSDKFKGYLLMIGIGAPVLSIIFLF